MPGTGDSGWVIVEDERVVEILVHLYHMNDREVIQTRILA